MRSATIAHGGIEKRQVTMAAPAKLGTFEFLWNGDDKAVLATRPLTVQ
ncbi:MAG: hypothetical protein U9Q81_19730 [Pseudomonadota bacterium]|nr:hypothetical protein [Pseudomonadota bacterium]